MNLLADAEIGEEEEENREESIIVVDVQPLTNKQRHQKNEHTANIIYMYIYNANKMSQRGMQVDIRERY